MEKSVIAKVGLMEELKDEKSSKSASVFTLLLHGMAENSSSHGIPNIKRAPNLTRRIFWTLIFLTALSTFLWQVTELVIKYYQYPVSVSVDINPAVAINFPAVTICNLNALKMTNLAAYGGRTLKSLLDVDSTSTSATTPASKKRRRRRRDTESILGSTVGEINEKASKWADVQNLLGQMNYSTRATLGHSLDSMLISCVFEEYTCGVSNFTTFFNYLYGNCYTFNFGVDGGTQVISKAGPTFGLDLELYVEQPEYIGDLSQEAGFKLVVHEQKIMPFPEDGGINLIPGHSVQVGFSAVTIDRLGSPYDDCNSATSSSETENVFSDFFGADYSSTACGKSCYHLEVIARCGCADIKYLYDNESDSCNFNNETQVACIETVDELYENDQLGCNCKVTCDEKLYRKTISSARWPSDVYVSEYIENLQGDETLRYAISNYSSVNTFAASNLVKVYVYFEDLLVETIVHDVGYDAFDLISDMGGQIGLWIGVSMCTIFEFLEFGWDLLLVLALKLSTVGQRYKANSPGGSPSKSKANSPAPAALNRVRPDLNNHIQLSEYGVQ